MRGAFFGAITSQAWALESVAHKADIAQQTKALGCRYGDGGSGRAVCAANVPLLAVRAISDTAKQALPVPFDQWFNIDEQRPRPGRLAAFLVKNPGRILPFTRFVAGLPHCRRALTGLSCGSSLHCRNRAINFPAAASYLSLMILRGAHLVLPDRVEPRCDVRVLGGRIAEIGANLGASEGEEVLDLTGQYLAPVSSICTSTELCVATRWRQQLGPLRRSAATTRPVARRHSR
jgi:hypothetical protein